MSLFLKVIIGCTIGSFIAMVLLACVNHFLDTHGLIRNREAATTFTKLTAFGLFLVLGYSLVALMLHVFVVAQGGIGNADVGMVSFLREHERGVTFGIWAFFTLGLLVALPVMWTDFFGFDKPLPKKQGAIVANIGMTISGVASRSTFQVAAGSREPLTGSSMSVNQGLFDFELAGAGVRFENCRYAFIQTGSHDDPKIVHMNVGLSPRKLPRDRFAGEHKDIIGRLQSAGWAAGHYEYSDPQDITLHGGTREGDGRYWAKDEALLLLTEKRMDDPKPGEDAATAGEFIHVIDVVPRDDSSYRKLVFEPIHQTKAAALH